MKKKTTVDYISLEEQKKLMLDMLKYVDDICRRNNINYSLCGGSLIGAIRHHGYIPWDDDIDIMLTLENYDKLKSILDKETGVYQTLKVGRGGEKFGFMKLIDTRTCLLEGGKHFDENYGVFIDIFFYCYMPDDREAQIKHYRRIKNAFRFAVRNKIDIMNKPIIMNFKSAMKDVVSFVVGRERIRRHYEAVVRKYSDTNYVLCCWPVYSFENEIQLKKNVKDYIDTQFEGLRVMIFKNYDEILKTTFGDYMKLPPKSERISNHNVKAWWREGYENAKK